MAEHLPFTRPSPVKASRCRHSPELAAWCLLCTPCGSGALRCTCPVGNDAIGPHTRGCPNHPEASR